MRKRGLEAVIKTGKSKKKGGVGRRGRARDFVEKYGSCPISMEPMRRPVLPSSGQVYDEVNLVRHCTGTTTKPKCPVSGAVLKYKNTKVCRTPDYNLRNMIRDQASLAKVYIAPLEKEELVRDLRRAYNKEAAKALVDDTFLGYFKIGELEQQLQELAQDCDNAQAVGVYCALVAECLACHVCPQIVALGAQAVEDSKVAWHHPRCFAEGLVAAQDPDCRGQLLNILEKRFQRGEYSPKQACQLLSFTTESVPVNQAQFRIAEMVLRRRGQNLPHQSADYEDALNKALRVRDDLVGCATHCSGNAVSFWKLGMEALKGLKPPRPLDTENVQRLFRGGRRSLLHTLAYDQPDLLLWHLTRHPDSLPLCVRVIGEMDCSSMRYTSEDEAYEDSDEDDDMYDEMEDGLAMFPHFSGIPRLSVA